MGISKQAWESGKHKHCMIFSNTYAKSFDYVSMLVNEARGDYPELKDENIRVVVYGGQRRKGMTGIEFEVEKIKGGYFAVNAPEPLA